MPVQDAEPVPQVLQLLMRADDMLGRIRDIRRAGWRTGVRRAGTRVRFFHVGASAVSPILRRESAAWMAVTLRGLTNSRRGGRISQASGRNSYSLITAATSSRPLGTPRSTR